MYADVIIDISHEKLDHVFTYHIPEKLECAVAPGVCVMIPFGRGDTGRTGYVTEIRETCDYDPAKVKDILGVIKSAVPAESHLMALAYWIKKNFGGTMHQALRTVLPVKVKTEEKVKRTVYLNVDRETAMDLLALYNRKHYRARVRLIAALLEEPSIPYEVILQKLNITAQTMRPLIEDGTIKVVSEKAYRNPTILAGEKQEGVTLNAEQQAVADGIFASFLEGDPKPALIKGVTGSGKTEVYMEIIARAAAMGKPSIMLIPEIALTYQTVMRFYKRFGDRVSILHSRLSKGERYDQYLRAKNGEIDVMIGPRSALFTPFTELGFIIIDEEHETTYKSETVPKYDAIPTAIERCRMLGGMTVLGSATPSLPSYYHAMQGDYTLYTLQNRATGASMAKVSVVSMAQEMQAGNRSVLSRELHDKIALRLERREQVMLFMNRRGIAGVISCRSCGEVIKCPHCDISMSQHNDGRMHCHYCGHTEVMATQCPVCGSTKIGAFKAGTQKIELLVQKEFPKARILRMDFDTTRGKDGHAKILSAFANQDADILLGTQMIVKGHDFPNVTLVGVLAADMSLNVPDYTAAERTFALLTQAAGRAGRARSDGEAVIQTYHPDHYAVVTAAAQDYEAFYAEEIGYRKSLQFPPVVHLLTVYVFGTDRSRVEKGALKLAGVLEAIGGLRYIGPAAPNMEKIKDNYQNVLYIKDAKYDTLVDIKDRMEAVVRLERTFDNLTVTFGFE